MGASPTKLATALVAIVSCFQGGLLLLWATPVTAKPFTTFESGQVRPLALSPDGSRLFAVNTPDGILEVFEIGPSGLIHAESVPVGLEPVAVAARTNTEVWVANHLSDSISIVDLSVVPSRVTRTLLVGDEPRDIVFAGARDALGFFPRAFVTTAHRGQSRRGDSELTTSGVGRADVWVFDAADLGTSAEGEELAIVTLFADTPRALAATPDGSVVYAAAFHSGNRTTTVPEGVVCDRSEPGVVAGPCEVFGVTMPGGLPLPHANYAGIVGPETGLIVKFDPSAGMWTDEIGRNWNAAVPFSLPDLDVFAIDALANPPAATTSWADVGTIVFSMAVNPVTGTVYVGNSEARNDVRFEGPGTLGTTVRGHLHETRITFVTDAGVTSRHLNKHIDYSAIPQPADVKERSLATPVGMAVSSDGQRLYVAAFGSAKIGVFETAELEADSFVPDSAAHIPISGGGPSGVILDEFRGRLYVLTRFDNSVSVVDLDQGPVGTEVAHVPLHNPEPAAVVEGRPFLYDAAFSSSNGEASCASCHVFADFDSLAWDLGNPNGDLVPIDPEFGLLGIFPLHPMKGPMTTQSLRGLSTHGPMHWRGDRSGAAAVPRGYRVEERAAFESFNVAFGGLLGRDEGQISPVAMRAFAEFVLQITYPPNPIRSLDNSLTPIEQRGRHFYFNVPAFGCNSCHRLNPGQGLFGTTGNLSADGLTQLFKIPQFRNLYQKVGKFGMPAWAFFFEGDNEYTGDQVRGFGYLHDGSTDTLFRHVRSVAFSDLPADPADEHLPGDAGRRDVEAFLLAYDSDLAPIVGQQVTRSTVNAAEAEPRVDLLMQRAGVPFQMLDHPGATECDLVVKGVLGSEARGWYRTSAGFFQSDRAWESPLTEEEIRAHAEVIGQARTFTCTPPGSGVRMGVDRDGDGLFDRDEVDAGLDPTFPDRIPGGGRRRSECTAEWLVNNPRNLPLVDHRGLPGTRQRCTDGDALCDTDGVANGQCVLAVGVCFNVDDPRPALSVGASACTPSTVESWEILRPRPDRGDPIRVANAAALRDVVEQLDETATAGPTDGHVSFAPPLGRTSVCTNAASITVPLKGTARNRRNQARIYMRTMTSPLPDRARIRDDDRLLLICEPSVP
jgi:DNA-binding beta-propeller fold protein YncE